MPRVWLFGDNVDTDQIVPGRYAPYMTSEAELGKYPFIEARPEFAKTVQRRSSPRALRASFTATRSTWGCPSSPPI
jgi:3-isopropylmalate dehydratase small subunit